MTQQATGSARGPVTPPLVLVVEDEEMVGEVVQAMLKMGGCNSVHANGPQEALEMLSDPHRRFDLLLTDYRMPQMSGIDLIQRCKALRPHLKTILYSGDVDVRETAHYPVQPDRILRKPFTTKVLNELVQAVLAS